MLYRGIQQFKFIGLLLSFRWIFTLDCFHFPSRFLIYVLSNPLSIYQTLTRTSIKLITTQRNNRIIHNFFLFWRKNFFEIFSCYTVKFLLPLSITKCYNNFAFSHYRYFSIPTKRLSIASIQKKKKKKKIGRIDDSSDHVVRRTMFSLAR